MAIMLSIIAVTLTGLACVAAWRAHRASHRLAREMVHLRDRLTRAESAREDAERRAAETPPLEDVDEALRERMASLEARLRDALEREAPVTAEGEHDVRDEIRTHLRRKGYGRVRFLAAREDGSILVEAERHGATTKGRAEVGADGRVRLRAVSSVRAFP